MNTMWSTDWAVAQPIPKEWDDMKRCLYLTVAALMLFSITACISSTPPRPVTLAEEAEVMAALQDRSFRAFHPSKDAEKRKGLILDFFGPVGLWAQYAVGKRAIDEWEIGAHEYRIEKHGDISEVTIHLEGAMTQRNLPDECDNCIPTAGVSISIRNLFDSDRITFRVNDLTAFCPLPSPSLSPGPDSPRTNTRTADNVASSLYPFRIYHSSWQT